MSDRRWTHETAGKIAQRIEDEFEINVSERTVHRLLGQLDYSLKSNKKCLSAGRSPYRDEQFSVIKRLRDEFAATGDPTISVDTKKKELIGLFKNAGRTWCRTGRKVNDHDFRSEARGLAAPYGIYDPRRNFGVLIVGQSADTPEFAVNSILTWWQKHGREDYPNAKRLLILADSGGSNGARPRAWKKFLQERLADECGLAVTVAHYPTGTSKWNPIEHRMFSEITKNWAGVPLESYETLVAFAQKTHTKAGLSVAAYHDTRDYEKGIKVTDAELYELEMCRNESIENWNYTIKPRRGNATAQTAPASLAIIPAIRTRHSPQVKKRPARFSKNGCRPSLRPDCRRGDLEHGIEIWR